MACRCRASPSPPPIPAWISWWYSTNAGASWQKFTTDGGASIGVHNALNLALDANTYVYFQPGSATVGGTVSNALVFRAWDQSAMTGANFTPGTLHDIDPNSGGFTGTTTDNRIEQSYSVQADTVTLQVEVPPQVVTSNGAATFTEPNNAPGLGATAAAAVKVAVDAGVTVADLDFTVPSATLSSATVQITGNYKSAEDVLSFANANGITGNWDSTAGTLTLTSTTATLAQWQAALRAVSYYDTSDTPNTAARTVTFTVHDTKRPARQRPRHPHGQCYLGRRLADPGRRDADPRRRRVGRGADRRRPSHRRRAVGNV